jgi:hypothetical protein
MNGNQIKHINIDRLEIRLRGGDSNSARALGASIGEEILTQIAQQTSVARNGQSTRIGHIDAGTVRLGSDTRGSDSYTPIARQIAAHVSSRIGPSSSRKS